MSFQPNEKPDLVSNKTGEKISKFTDYIEEGHWNNFNKDDAQKIIRDVFYILFQDSENQTEEIKKYLETKKKELEIFFKVEEIPLMKLESSLWHQFTKDEKLGQSVQGVRTATVDGKKINIPHIGFSADLDYLDDLINNVIKKAKQLNIKD